MGGEEAPKAAWCWEVEWMQEEAGLCTLGSRGKTRADFPQNPQQAFYDQKNGQDAGNCSLAALTLDLGLKRVCKHGYSVHFLFF